MNPWHHVEFVPLTVAGQRRHLPASSIKRPLARQKLHMLRCTSSFVTEAYNTVRLIPRLALQVFQEKLQTDTNEDQSTNSSHSFPNDLSQVTAERHPRYSHYKGSNTNHNAGLNNRHL
jgi:hypothetical protein